MKNWKKYLLSTVAFYIMYTLVRCTPTIVGTLIYGILYMGIDLVCNKFKRIGEL